jgi:hypothetical protein
VIAAEKGKLLIQAFVCDVLTPGANRALQPVARQGAAATGPETEEAAHLRAQWFRLKEDLQAAKYIPVERARGGKGLVVREREARKEWRACLRREEQEAVRVLQARQPSDPEVWKKTRAPRPAQQPLRSVQLPSGEVVRGDGVPAAVAGEF